MAQRLRTAIGNRINNYVERHHANLPLNVLGRVAIGGGFAGMIMRTVENAPSEAGIKPLAVIAVGCALEVATRPSTSE